MGQNRKVDINSCFQTGWAAFEGPAPWLEALTSQAEPSMRDPLVAKACRARTPALFYARSGSRDHDGLDLGQGHPSLVSQLGISSRVLGFQPIPDEPNWIAGFALARQTPTPDFGPIENGVIELAHQHVLPAMLKGEAATSREGRPHLAMAAYEKLGETQRALLPFLVEGLSEAEIAARIFRSRHTVHDHVKKIYRLLGVSNRVELALRFAPLLESMKRDGTLR